MNKSFSELTEAEKTIVLNRLAKERTVLFSADYGFVWAITPETLESPYYRPMIIEHLNKQQFNEHLELL